jgi:hypothetical protein
MFKQLYNLSKEPKFDNELKTKLNIINDEIIHTHNNSPLLEHIEEHNDFIH